MAPPPRPENVLKRADELAAMDKPAAALDLLYETIMSRRTRNVSLSFLDPIVLRLMELSVELRRSKVAKDALHQFKKVVAGGSVNSLEAAVDKLLSVAEAKVADAQAEAEKITIDEDDLEAEQSPEDLLMGTVSSEQTRDRTDRKVVTPWLKFLWEAYRLVLDVLRNNSSLLALYTKVADQAFKFCLRFQRKVEFRRLCELLRNHVQLAGQQPRTPNAPAAAIDLNNPETLQLFLDTRFEQLNGAVKLELWQEAFRSVEDVHNLLISSRRPIRIAHMASYYETLARIFLVGNNYLFHSAAWAKFYSMVYHTRHSAPAGQLERIASYFLLSVLCIPREDPTAASCSPASLHSLAFRNARLSSLLNLSDVPTRESLMTAALCKNVLQYAKPEICDLYTLLETDFHPLTVKRRLEPIIEVLASTKAYSSYVQPLLQVVVSAVFKHLSQIYTTVKLDFVLELVSLPAPFDLSRVELEKRLVFGSAAGEFRVRINHRENQVTFVDSFSSAAIASSLTKGALEPVPAALIRSRLHDFAMEITTVAPKVDDKVAKDTLISKESRLRAIAQGLREENLEFLERQEAQAERLEETRKAQLEREANAIREAAERAAREKVAAEKRQLEEKIRRDRERIEREKKAIENETKRQMAEAINAKGVVKIDLEKLDEISPEAFQHMQVSQLEKESKDLRTRMKQVARKYDHLERAFRREEALLWKNEAAQQAARDKEIWEARREVQAKQAVQRAEQARMAKKRFTRMSAQYHDFIAKVDDRHREEIKQLKERNIKLLAEAKEKRIAEVAAKRKAAEEAAAAKAEQERLAEERRKADLEAAAERQKKVFTPSAIKNITASAMGNAPAPVAAPRPAAAAPAAASKANPFGRAASSGASPFGSAKAVAIDHETGTKIGAPTASKLPAVAPRQTAAPAARAPAAAPAARAPAAATPKANPFGQGKAVDKEAKLRELEARMAAKKAANAGASAPSGQNPFGSRDGQPRAPGAIGEGRPKASSGGAYVPPQLRKKN